MGQVFTDKVDVTKLREGKRVVVNTPAQVLSGILYLEFGDWGVRDEEHSHLFWVCRDDGGFFNSVESLEILDADPAEKMQAEHAEMLSLLEEIYRLPYSLEEMRVMVQKFLLNRKAQQ